MSNKISVLVAEDNPSIVDAIKYWHSKYFTLVFVNNINVAIKTIKNGFIPEVALVDWKLKACSSSDETERLRLYVNESFELIKYIREETQERCRTVLMSSLDYKPAIWFFNRVEAWGYFYKASDIRSLKDVFEKGFLEDGEVGKPIILLPYVEPHICKERE